MRRMAISLCLVTVFVVGAFAAASASAEPDRIPGTGSCYSVPPETGNFLEGACESYAKPHDWDWCWNDQAWPNPCPIHRNWWWELAKAEVATANFAVACAKMKSAGTFTESGNDALASLAMTGCTVKAKGSTLNGATCQNAGVAGEIDTDALEGTLGYVSEHGVGMELSAPGGTIAEAECGGEHLSITGSVVGTVPANKPEAKLKISFKEKKGKPATGGFEGGAAQSLKVSVGGGEPEEAGLKASIAQVNENKKEKTEIRCHITETGEVAPC